MFTKQSVINTIKQEHQIIKHLAAKITTEEQLAYKPNNQQRSLKELLAYMTQMSSSFVTMIKNKEYNPEAAKTQRLSLEKLNVLTEFESAFDAQLAVITDYILSITEEEMTESLDIFKMGTPMPVSDYLMIVLRQYPAYRMQLFLYLKSGLNMTDLNTMNVWMGQDTPAKKEAETV